MIKFTKFLKKKLTQPWKSLLNSGGFYEKRKQDRTQNADVSEATFHPIARENNQIRAKLDQNVKSDKANVKSTQTNILLPVETQISF